MELLYCSIIEHGGDMEVENNLSCSKLETIGENSIFNIENLKSNLFDTNFAEINETLSKQIWVKHIYPLTDKPIEVIKFLKNLI